MKHVLRFAAVAAVVVVVALVTRHLGWWGAKKGTSAGKALPAAAETGPAPAASEPRTPAPSPGRAPVVRDDDPRGTLRLEGIVLDAAEQGVGGAQVTIDSVPPRTISADSGGSFAFEALIARDYRLEAIAGEQHAGPVRLRLSSGSGLVTLRMKPAGTVLVTVRAADGGAPVANAEVELRDTLAYRATTGADGVATLRGVGATWGTLRASAAGFAPASTMVETTGDPAAPARFELALARGAAVSGRVVDDRGAPIAGAQVVATSASEPFPVADVRRDGVTTGADGTFTIAAVAAGTWRLDARDGEHAPGASAPFLVDGVNPRTGMTVVLGAGGIVRGTVTTAAGAPIAGADVRVVTRGHVFWRPRRQAFTDGEGRFVIEGLPRRELDVVAWHPDGASAIVPADLASARERSIALVLDVQGAIEGVVVDRANAGIGDAQVLAEPVTTGPADLQGWSVRGVQQALTDPDGHFRISGLPAGDYRVHAARGDAGEEALWTSASTVTRPGAAPLRLVLSGDGRITGKVAFADGRAPAIVTLALDGGSGRPSGKGDGSFAIDAIGGEHLVVIGGPGFVPVTRRGVKVVEGEVTDLGAITVEAGRSISGRVTDGAGTPVAGATVAAGTQISGGGSELFIEGESPGARSAVTDADGRYLITGFLPRGLVIVAGKEGVGRSSSVAIPRGPDSVVVDLVLGPVGSMAGTVTRNGQPLAETVVIANPAAATTSNFFVVTGADGSFAFDALAPGSYIVFAMVGGGGPRPKDMYMRRVEVSAGARATASVDASTGPGTLAVDVVTDAGTPVVMAQMFVVRAVVDVANVAMMRDGSWMPPELAGDETLPLHLRTAMGKPVSLEGVRAGAYTACAVPFPVRSPQEAMAMAEDAEILPMKCVPVTIAGSAPVKTTITVPAAWATPRS